MAVRTIAVNIIARIGEFNRNVTKAMSSLNNVARGARQVNNLLGFVGASFSIGAVVRMFNAATEATRAWGKEILAGKKALDEIKNTKNLSMVLGTTLRGDEIAERYRQSQLSLGAAAGGSPADVTKMALTVINGFMSRLTETLGGTLEEWIYARRESSSISKVYGDLQNVNKDLLRYEKIRLENVRKQASWEKWWGETRKRTLQYNEMLYADEQAEKKARMQEEWDRKSRMQETANEIIESQKTMAKKIMDYAKTLDELGLAGMLTQEQITRAMREYEKSLIKPMRGGSAKAVSPGMDIATMVIGGDNAIVKQLIASNQHLSQISANTRYTAN